MPETEMILGVAGGVLMLCAFVALLRFLRTWLMHSTLRQAISQDSASAAELIERIERSGNRAGRSTDDRSGLVLIAIGVATLGFALIAGDSDWRYLAGGSLFPLLVGAALLARHVWQARRGEPVLADAT